MILASFGEAIAEVFGTIMLFALLIGIVGITLLVIVICLIILAIVKHHRKKKESSKNKKYVKEKNKTRKR